MERFLPVRNSIYSSFFSVIDRTYSRQENECTKILVPCVFQLLSSFSETTLQVCNKFFLDSIESETEVSGNEDKWSPIALAVKGCHHVHPNAQGSNLSILFFGLLASKGAEQCLTEIAQNWEKCVEECEIRYETIDGAFDYRILARSEAAFQIINQAGPKLTNDGNRFLAAVDLAACSSQMGMIIACSSSNDRKDFFDKTIEVGVICDYYKRLESLCNQVKKQVNSVLADPNMRRVKALLSYLSVFYGHCCSMSKSLAGIRAFNQQQGNLESWIFQDGSKKVSNDYSSDENSSDED